MAGDLEQALLADLQEWDVSATGSRAVLALVLARTLDAGAGLSTAAVARELRAVLTELAPKVDDDADHDAALVAGLSTPVGDTKN